MKTASRLFVVVLLTLGLPATGACTKHAAQRDAKNASAPPSGASVKTSRGQVRHIVRKAALAVTVKKVSAARQKVEALATATGGYLHRADLSADGSPGRWTATLKVPQAKLMLVLGRLRALGKVTRETLGTEEVTQAVLDVQARLKNLRQSEGRHQLIAQRSGSSVEELLKVETQIGKIRGRIEQLEARDRHFSRATRYATVLITLVPRETTAAGTGTWTKISRAFLGGFGHVRDVGVWLLVVLGHTWALVLLGLILMVVTTRLVVRLTPRFVRLFGLPARTPSNGPHHAYAAGPHHAYAATPVYGAYRPPHTAPPTGQPPSPESPTSETTNETPDE